jgi:hypothetical protein
MQAQTRFQPVVRHLDFIIGCHSFAIPGNRP